MFPADVLPRQMGFDGESRIALGHFTLINGFWRGIYEHKNQLPDKKRIITTRKPCSGSDTAPILRFILRWMMREEAEIHTNVDNFCGKKVFVCKTRKWLWEHCFLKMGVIHRKWINLWIKKASCEK